MSNSIKRQITRNLNYNCSFLLLFFLLFSTLPGELESRSNTVVVHSNVKWLPNKPPGKMYTITDSLGATINEIARNETAYLVGTIFTGTPIYPGPLEVWGYITGAGKPIDQGLIFGKGQTDPDNNHKFVIPLHNGTDESLAIYQSLKGSYQVSAYVPDYTQIPDNFIIEPPGSWGTPDTLDMLAYSEINVIIDGETILDDPYAVVRGQKLDVKLEAHYDDSSWIDSSKTAIRMTLQTPFNSEGWSEKTKSVQESIPDPIFTIGVPTGQPAGIYLLTAILDHNTFSSVADPYLKGSTTGWITQSTFKIEVLDTEDHYSRVDVTGPFVMNPGTTIWMTAVAANLEDNTPLTSPEGLDLTLKGAFNGTVNNSFSTTKTVYDNIFYYTYMIQVPIGQPEGEYEFLVRLDHEEHSTQQDPLLRGETTDYTSEDRFDVEVTKDPLILFYNPDRSRYVWRNNRLDVGGFISTSLGGVPIEVHIGSKDHDDTYVEESTDTDGTGGFTVTFEDLLDVPTGRTLHLWAESPGYDSEHRNIVIRSETIIKIDGFDPDPGLSGKPIHVYGSLRDRVGSVTGEGVSQKAISIRVVDEDITLSGNTDSNGLFDVPIIITGVNQPENFRIIAEFDGKIPYYTDSSSSSEVTVTPLLPPDYILELNITDAQPPPDVVTRLRNESILVQGHFKNESETFQEIRPVPDTDIEVYLGSQDQNTIYMRETTTTDELADFVVPLWLNGSIPVGDLLIWADAPDSGLDPTSETEEVRIWSFSEIDKMEVQPLEFDRAFSGGEIQVNGTLIDDQGQPIDFAIISFNWNGEAPVAESSTDENGQFSTILLVPTVPEVTIKTLFAIFESTEFYEESMAESSVEITPYGPTFLDITVDRTSVYMGENITVTGTLTDQFGDPVPAGQTITMTWDGYFDSVSATTDLNSAFSATTSAPIVDSTGSYLLRTSFAQITGYQDAVANATIHIFVGAQFEDVRLIAAVYNETAQKVNLARVAGVTYEPNINVTVQGTLSDDFGTPLKNRPLQVILVNNITGSTVTQVNATTDRNGQFSAMIRPTPSPGTYQFELHFITETGADFPINTTIFTILNPPGPDLFTFILVDGFGVLGGVIIAYLLHRRGLILSRA